MAKQRSKGLTALVVDDQLMTRTLVKDILRGMGIPEIVQADNGADALNAIAGGGIDIVVCDWNMPHGNGFEVLTAIRKIEQCKTLPFVMLTAEAYRENIAAAIGAGVTDYVIKPFSPSVLMEKVHKVLKDAGKKIY